MSKPNTPPAKDKPAASNVERKAPPTALYLVGATPILRDGERFEPGSPIELRADQAARLGLRPADAAE